MHHKLDEDAVKTSPRGKGRPSARTAILDAAVNVVMEIGARRMTLESVALRAGVSKGGLLYHFPTKEDLLAGMIQCHIDDLVATPTFFDRLASDNPGAGLKALAEQRNASMDANEIKRETASCLMAAAAERPDLLEPVRKFHRTIWSAIESGAVARSQIPALLVAWFALEGECHLSLLNISPGMPDLRQQMIETAFAMLDGRLVLTPAEPDETPAA